MYVRLGVYVLYINIDTHIKLQSKAKHKVSGKGTDLSLYFV